MNNRQHNSNIDSSIAGFFFTTFLEGLGCHQVKTEQNMASDDQLICGFNSDHPHIQSMISALLPEYKIYQKNPDHYIICFSKKAIEKKWEYYFKKALDSVLEKLPLLRTYGYYNYNNDRAHKYAFLLDNLPPNFKHTNIAIFTALAKIGLGFRAEHYITEDYSIPMEHIFQPWASIETTWLLPQLHHCLIDEKLIAVDDFTKFVQCVVLPDIENEASKKIRQQRIKTFIMNTPMKLNRHHEIFKFYDQKHTEEKSDIDEKSMPVPLLTPEQERLEKKWAIAIENRVRTLTEEAGSSFHPNENLKKQKIKFLQLVLGFKRTNPHFLLAECIKYAKCNDPALYQQAIQGKLSTVTRDLLNKIVLDSKPQMTAVPRRAHHL